MTPTRIQLADFAVCTLLSAVIGGVIYAFAPVFRQYGMQPHMAAGIALFMATPVTLPTALATNLVLFLGLKRNRWPMLGWAAAALTGLGATFAFPLCMHILAPTIDWNRGILLPAGTVIAALAIWLFRSLSWHQSQSI